MTDETSARLRLPMLQPGQAQKEMTHNEALALIDLALGASVREAGLDTPPATPAIGESWIVGVAPTGDWRDQPQAIAGWTGGGWRFVEPFEGLSVWVEASGVPARFVSGAWRAGDLAATRVLVGGVPVLGARAAAVPHPAGGATIDAECRAAVIGILDALRGHGLIAS